MAGKAPAKESDSIDFAATIAAALGAVDPRPKFIVRPDCEIVWQSSSASLLLQTPLPVQLSANRLEFDKHIRVNGVQKFLEEATAATRNCLLRSKTTSHWVLLRAWALDAPQHAIAVVCSLSIPCRSVAESGLADELNLTPSEIQVLDLFAQLHSPKEIAEDLHVSLATVRSHLKQIYSKSAVGSVVQLLQLTRTYCAN